MNVYERGGNRPRRVGRWAGESAGLESSSEVKWLGQVNLGGQQLTVVEDKLF